MDTEPTMPARQTEPTMPAREVVQAWADALAAADAARLEPLMAPDVVLHSPLTNAFVFTRRPAVTAVFASAFELIRRIDVQHRIGPDPTDPTDPTGVVVFAGVVNGQPMQEMHLLRVQDGLVAEVTLMGRPVPALLHVMARIPPLLAERGVMPKAAGPAAAGIRPLGALLAAVDRHLVPRLPPR